MRLGLVLIAIVFGVAFLATPNHCFRQQPRSDVSASIIGSSSGVILRETRTPNEAERADAVRGLKLPDLDHFLSAFANRPEEALLRFRAAAADNPSVVSDWWAQLPPGAAREATLPQLSAAWVETDLVGASLWCQQLPAGAEREQAILIISQEVAHSDPETALALASLLADPAAQDGAVSHAYTQWAARDSDAARAWAEQLPPGPLREHTLTELALVLAERDGVSAASLVASDISEEQDQAAAAVGVVQRWAQKNPSQAADWVALFPEGDTLNNAAFELMSIWSATKPDQVPGWLESVPEGPFRNACVQALATLSADTAIF